MRVVKNIFSPKSTRLIRVLLTNFRKHWTILELSKVSNISLGYSHAVISSLIEQGYVNRDNVNKIQLIDPYKLLRRWAAYNNYTVNNTFIGFHTFDQNIDSFLNKIQTVNSSEYALTTLAGAHLIAPYVRPTTIHFYIKQRKQSEFWKKKLKLRAVEQGGNVSLVIPEDEGVFFGVQRINSINIVNNVQLYVDLFNYPARGEEAASRILTLIEKDFKNQL